MITYSLCEQHLLKLPCHIHFLFLLSKNRDENRMGVGFYINTPHSVHSNVCNENSVSSWQGLGVAVEPRKAVQVMGSAWVKADSFYK